MITKTDRDEIQSFLADASNLAGGYASHVLVPESAGEVALALAQATAERTPVSRASLDELLALAEEAIERLREAQLRACGELPPG